MNLIAGTGWPVFKLAPGQRPPQALVKKKEQDGRLSQAPPGIRCNLLARQALGLDALLAMDRHYGRNNAGRGTSH